MTKDNKQSQIVPWKAAIAEAQASFMEIAKAEGNLVTYQKEAMFAMQRVAESDMLQRCDPASIRNAVINIASVGLSLNPATKHAYLVPRDGKAVLDISYMGLLHIATESGSVLAAKAEVVRANDQFEYRGPFETPFHRFNPFSKREARGDIIGVYCAAQLHNGGVIVDSMGMEDIEEVREKSKAYNRGNGKAPSGPWVDFPEEMIKKSVLKRASKTWPKNDRISKAAHVLNEHEGLRAEYTAADVMPAAAVVLVSDEQINQIIAECQRTGVNPEKVATMYSVAAINDLPAAHFEEALSRLKAKEDRKNPKEQPKAEQAAGAATG